jgi:hypothetical protein
MFSGRKKIFLQEAVFRELPEEYWDKSGKAWKCGYLNPRRQKTGRRPVSCRQTKNVFRSTGRACSCPKGRYLRISILPGYCRNSGI